MKKMKAVVALAIVLAASGCGPSSSIKCVSPGDQIEIDVLRTRSGEVGRSRIYLFDVSETGELVPVPAPGAQR